MAMAPGTKTCAVPYCDRADLKARGLCPRCYQAWKRGSLEIDAPRERQERTGRCTIEGCPRPDDGRGGRCNRHYLRLLRHGDPAVRKYVRGSLEERLLARRIKTANGCWEYDGYHDKFGYGRMARNRRMPRVHVVSYETFVGPVPAGLQVDHLCCNKGCFNPEHLEAVTCSENVQRAYANGLHPDRKRSHCFRGHALIPENLYIDPAGKRHCVQCRRDRQGVKEQRVTYDGKPHGRRYRS